MTTVAEDTEKAKAETIKARNKEMETREKALNEGKTGKGTRTFLGMTRGKGPKEIQYENWDETQPDTLPKSFGEIIDIHKTRGQEGDPAEKEIVRRWILGDNDVLYSEASDPIAEFLEPEWEPDYKLRFKLVIKNYAANTGLSIEDTVALLKPAMVAALTKQK